MMKRPRVRRHGKDTDRRVQEVIGRGIKLAKEAGPAATSGDDDNLTSTADVHSCLVAVLSIPVVSRLTVFRLGRARKRVEKAAMIVLAALQRSKHRAVTGRYAAAERSEPQIRARRVAEHRSPLLSAVMLLVLNVAIFVADFFLIRAVLADLADSHGFFTTATLSSSAIALFIRVAVIVSARSVGTDVALAWRDWKQKVQQETDAGEPVDDRYPEPRGKWASRGFGWLRFVHPQAFFGAVLLFVLSFVLGGVAWWRFDQETAGIGAVQAPVEMFVIVFAVLPWIAVYAHARAWDEETERERPVLRRAWVGGVLASREDTRLRRANGRLARVHTALHDQLEHVLRRMEVPQEVIARLRLEQLVYSGEHRAPQLSVIPYPANGKGADGTHHGPPWWADILSSTPQLAEPWSLPWLDRRVRAALQVLHQKRPLDHHLTFVQAVDLMHAVTHSQHAAAYEVETAAERAAKSFEPPATAPAARTLHSA